MTTIAVAGAGRMGQALVRLAQDNDDLTLTAIWVREPATSTIAVTDTVLVSDDLAAVCAAADVLIDFSLPEATRQIIATVTRQGKALVCGVSGLDELQMAAIDKAAGKIPLLYDRNMSQGIAVLDAVIRDVVGALGPEFSVEIHETHHAHKQDAPSGTALKLGEAVKDARRSKWAGRIHYESVRQGEVVLLETNLDDVSGLVLGYTQERLFAIGALDGWNTPIQMKKNRPGTELSGL
ncbi:MAG: DUF111 family protein, partial [Proteobacteria bacterium]|nr:DUF111 family protein [Pseudomonadota bacterium]